MSEFKPRKNMLYKEIHVDNFREMIDYTANTYKDRIAFSYKKDKTSKNPEYINISYKKHKEDIEAFSTKLLELGLEGKRIAIISHNKYQWPLSYMAINNGNMVVVPLDYMLPENEIESLIKRSEAEAVIFENKYESIFKKIKQSKESNLKYLINMDLEKSSEEVYSFYELLKEGYELLKEGNTIYKNIKIDNDKMSIMLFTSGTTGVSKAVELSQKNICSNVSAMTTLIKMNDKDSVLSFLPLHHTFECTATYLFCFFTGCRICYCDGLKHIPQNMKEYEISGLVCVPALLDVMYRQINKTIKNKNLTIPFKILMGFSNFLRFFHIDLRRKLFKSILDNLGGRLRIVIYGSASADKEVIKFFNNIGVKMIQGYGLTETSPVISCENDKYQKPGTAGFVLYNEDVKIINKDEKGIGEITVKGPNVMKGYYENEEATNESFIDGYFKTGDLGYLDKQGYLHVTGRIKEMIVLKNGKKVFPQEIETLINESPYVEESFVYGKIQNDGNVKISVKVVYSEENEKLKGKSKEEIKDILEKGKESGKYQVEFGTIGKGLSEIVKDEIVALNLQGIDFLKDIKRYYPNGDFASYMLGYTILKEDKDNNKWITGEMGLEEYYNSDLKGKAGYRTYEKDKYGYKIANGREYVSPSEQGKDIYLTVDSNIQLFLENAVKKAEADSEAEWTLLVAADAKTGAILGYSSTPSFDPNLRNMTSYVDPLVTLSYLL